MRWSSTGFASRLAVLLPGVTVHGYIDSLTVKGYAAKDKKTGKTDAENSTLTPEAYAQEELRYNTNDKSFNPADLNQDGTVTNLEESTWMKSAQ